MKRILGSLVVLVLSVFVADAQNTDTIVELPFRLVDGYGSFLPNYVFVSWDDTTKTSEWSKTYDRIRGIPTTWSQLKLGRVLLDDKQYAYQNAKQNRLSATFFEESQTGWGWKPDPKILSSQPIKCFVYVATGFDSTGKRLVLIDTNNNLDFSDEPSFQPPSYSYNALADLSNIRQIQYQRYQNGQVLDVKTKIVIWYTAQGLGCSFPFYAVASFPERPGSDQIAVVSADFRNPNFLPSTAIVINDSLESKQSAVKPRPKIMTKLMSKEDEYVVLNRITYQYKGIDLAKNVIRLKKVSKTDSLYSTQRGFKAHPFEAIDITSNQPVSLAKYRGKYVLLDFWGTWCAPCLAEMPKLKAAYSQTSRDDIEFIGIVSNDTPEKVKAYLAKSGIQWPQVMSTDVNKLVETYRVNSYPTTILIDPQGVVVSPGISGAYLVESLLRLKALKH